MRSDSYYAAHRRGKRALRVRRLALTAVAAALIVIAEALAGFRSEAPSTNHPSHPRKAATHTASSYGGEPRPSQSSTVPRAVWTAAVRFVRDYAGWEADRLTRIPSHDATERVIDLLKDAGRHRLAARRGIRPSVRMTASGGRQYVVISVVGNFLIGRRGSQWLAVSTPGD
jgi:hypothetical protein